MCHQSLCLAGALRSIEHFINFFFRKLQENTYFPEYSGISLILSSAPGSIISRGVKKEKREWNRISAQESIFWVSIDAQKIKLFHR